ncbi:MAG: pth [Pedosphaera sp.]|nr:pth [Pedosphaera sp.]
MAAILTPDMESLRLIVGLGNPGAKYAKTRHNVGFQLVERLAKQWQVGWTTEKKFQSNVARVERNGVPVILCEPQTYMNVSGEAVGALVSFYRVPLTQVVVAVDDADLPLGQIRMRMRGSSGGHHGLESIEKHLGTSDFARLRIGIGRAADGQRQIANYVLAPFEATEAVLVDKVITVASEQIECWLSAGIEKAMSQFNGVVKDSA